MPSVYCLINGTLGNFCVSHHYTSELEVTHSLNHLNKLSHHIILTSTYTGCSVRIGVLVILLFSSKNHCNNPANNHHNRISQTQK